MEDTFNISIGQGGLRQSPLQMACFISKLATNSKFFTPKLNFDEILQTNKQVKLTKAPRIDKLLWMEWFWLLRKALREGVK